MRQQRPSFLFIAMLVLLVSIGLGALIVLSVRRTRPSELPPTVAPIVTVLVEGTAAGVPVSPSPSATAQPTESILRPTSTRVPPLVLVDTPTPTPTAAPPTPTAAVQKG